MFEICDIAPQKSNCITNLLDGRSVNKIFSRVMNTLMLI